MIKTKQNMHLDIIQFISHFGNKFDARSVQEMYLQTSLAGFHFNINSKYTCMHIYVIIIIKIVRNSDLILNIRLY